MKETTVGKLLEQEIKATGKSKYEVMFRAHGSGGAEVPKTIYFVFAPGRNIQMKVAKRYLDKVGWEVETIATNRTTGEKVKITNIA